MIMDFARIEKEYGSLQLRILDHVTYMYYLAFFIDKDNPRKQGKGSKYDLLTFIIYITSFLTGFNTVVGRLRDGGIIDHLMFQVMSNKIIYLTIY